MANITYYVVVIEQWPNGAASAYIPGLPVHTAADSTEDAQRAIAKLLETYLAANPQTPAPQVRVVCVEPSAAPHVTIIKLPDLVEVGAHSAQYRYCCHACQQHSAILVYERFGIRSFLCLVCESTWDESVSMPRGVQDVGE